MFKQLEMSRKSPQHEERKNSGNNIPATRAFHTSSLRSPMDFKELFRRRCTFYITPLRKQGSEGTRYQNNNNNKKRTPMPMCEILHGTK